MLWFFYSVKLKLLLNYNGIGIKAKQSLHLRNNCLLPN
ncbi:MAG: hypothetical protein JWQ54_5453 [Mucilaginibacter sp.]|nr:hypothetical protein [Mucilaginibacter sp.]